MFLDGLRALIAGVRKDVRIGAFSAGQVMTYNGTTNTFEGAAGGGGNVNGTPPTTLGNVAEWGNTLGTSIVNSTKVVARLVENNSAAAPNFGIPIFNGTNGRNITADNNILSPAAGQVQAQRFIGPATGLRETGGPTDLTMGAVASGALLVRSGSTIVGASAANLPLHASSHLVGGSDTMFPGTWGSIDFPMWNGSAFVPKQSAVLMLLADQTAIGTSLTTITNLQVVLNPGTHFFRMDGWYWSNAAGTGFALGLAFSGTSSSQLICCQIDDTTFPGTALDGTSLSTKIGVTTNAPTTLATRLPFSMQGRIVVTVAGTLSFQASTGGATGGTSTNVARGTTARVQQV